MYFTKNTFYCILLLLHVTTILSGNLKSKSSCQFTSNLPHEIFSTISHEKGQILPQLDPENKNWSVEIKSGMEVTFHCDQGHNDENTLRYFESKHLIAICMEGLLQTKLGAINFNQLICREPKTSSAVRNGTCHNYKTRIEIILTETGAPCFWCCHDEDTSNTLYTVSTIDGPKMSQGQETVDRPSFVEGLFYPTLDVNQCYTQKEQNLTVAQLLNSPELAASYIQTSNYYMARGHLTPDADGCEANERLATYYYVNVVPQWQIINAGNWLKLETACRDYAKAKGVILNIYTGTWNVATLKNPGGQNIKIHLGKEGGHPIEKLASPSVMWKVIHDPVSGGAVAILMLNNPYPDNHNEGDKNLCTDVCPQLNWINWDVKNSAKGLTYCCDVASFFKAVPYAPNLGSRPLLNY